MLVHGRGATREECLRALPVLHRLGFPALVVSYRNVNFPPEPTRLEVRFDPAPGGTRVRLEHSELVDISERMRENAWVNFIGWYRDYVAEKCS